MNQAVQTVQSDPVEQAALSLSGQVDSIFYAAENYYVFAVTDERGDQVIAVSKQEVEEGVWIRATGKYVEHKRYGRQFQCALVEKSAPSGEYALILYLSSGAFKGIGPGIAKKIVAHFGEDTKRIMEDEPERLKEVKGLGKKKAESIVEKMSSDKGLTKMIAELAPYGVSVAKAVQIAKHMNVETLEDAEIAIKRIADNPYQLTQIKGIGFKTVDRYALEMGIEKESDFRILAGLKYVIESITMFGHCGAPQAEFFEKAARMLEVSTSVIQGMIENAVGFRVLIRDKDSDGVDCFFDPYLYVQEKSIADNINYLLESSASCADMIEEDDLFTLISEYKALDKGKVIPISDGQRRALAVVMSSPIACLIGGPGMGKTTIVRVLLDLMSNYGMKVVMAAPTGKAAKRASESTGREVQTIHRLLEFNPASGFGKNSACPLDADLVVVDEASMIDIPLAASLFKAIGAGTSVIFVGDVDQLPSVGPGKFLKDLLDSGRVAVGQLTEVFRQAAGSKIIEAAYQVNSGIVPPFCDEDDLTIYELGEDEEPSEAVEREINRSMHQYNYRKQDIQVLAPMKKGNGGSEILNLIGQVLLNEGDTGLRFKRFDVEYWVGDRVMQTRNEYQKNVFNGEMGIIQDIDPKKRKFDVDYPEKGIIDYVEQELDDLMMAYAITVHRFQGSESPCVIMTLLNSHYMMLKRNMFYTGITRAAKRLVIVTQKRAMEMAVKTIDGTQRVSKLRYMLQNPTNLFR